MRGDGFWKRIVILCLTFWLGAFVASLFETKKSPDETVVTKKLNCVPVDKSLQYRFLNEDQKERVLYRPDKDRFEYQTLLHKEHCYESKE